MGISGGPDTIQDGLILCLDASDKNSYPGSGTTWTDVAGTNNGTLTNGPTFNSANGGSIVFDGTNDYVGCGTSTPPSGNISIFTWIYPTYFNSTWNILITKWFNPTGTDFHYALKSNGGNGTNIRQNLYTTSNSDIYGNYVFSLNNWYNVGFTLVNGGTLTFYVNGNTDGTSNTVSRTTQSSTLQIGDDRGTYYSLSGSLSSVKIYNRALSQSEVLQNYNAQKSRFGL
jgi:hypothetical protein